MLNLKSEYDEREIKDLGVWQERELDYFEQRATATERHFFMAGPAAWDRSDLVFHVNGNIARATQTPRMRPCLIDPINVVMHTDLEKYTGIKSATASDDSDSPTNYLRALEKWHMDHRDVIVVIPKDTTPVMTLTEIKYMLNYKKDGQEFHIFCQDIAKLLAQMGPLTDHEQKTIIECCTHYTEMSEVADWIIEKCN